MSERGTGLSAVGLMVPEYARTDHVLGLRNPLAKFPVIP